MNLDLSTETQSNEDDIDIPKNEIQAIKERLTLLEGIIESYERKLVVSYHWIVSSTPLGS